MSTRYLQGRDLAHHARLLGEQLEREHEANKHQQEAPWEAPETRQCHVMVEQHGVTGPIKVSTVDAPPFVGRLGAVARTEQKALAELRFKWACALVEAGVLNCIDDARAHVLRTQIVPHREGPRIMTVVR